MLDDIFAQLYRARHRHSIPSDTEDMPFAAMDRIASAAARILAGLALAHHRADFAETGLRSSCKPSFLPVLPEQWTYPLLKLP